MADWTSVVAAVCGGAIAAIASYLTSRADARRQRDERAEERSEAARKEALALRRATYTELYAAMRYYRSALLDFAAVTGPTCPSKDAEDAAREQVEKARVSTAECYSNAQMIIPGSLLGLARAAQVRLGDAYRLLTRTPDLEARLVREFIRDNVSPALTELRDALRVDLGIVHGLSEPEEID